MRGIGKYPIILASVSIFALVVFVKNAWVSEDAYILFRSVEQFHSGNGPNWNPHERVQVFTSPLWYGVLSLSRVFSKDLYLNSILISLVLVLLMIYMISRVLKDSILVSGGLLLLMASNGFYDFTSSGLENPAAYVLILILLERYVSFFEESETPGTSPDGNGPAPSDPARSLLSVCMIAGFVLMVRHDLMTIILLPLGHMMFCCRSRLGKKELFLSISAVLGPIFIWSVFSLCYYGFLLPNTAYAKLDTGISKDQLILQGGRYLLSSFAYDSITLYVILVSLIYCLCSPGKKYLNSFAGGVVLNLFYVLYVGGDFMQGRFLSCSYLVCVLILLLKRPVFKGGRGKTAFISLIIYLCFYPHTPFNSPVHYSEKYIDLGIADERGFYFNELSLYKYLKNLQDGKGIFPVHALYLEGLDFRKSPVKVSVNKNAGMFAYASGTHKIIIDPRALTDPLLARLPVAGEWRVGHYSRTLPEGYVESLEKGISCIKDRKVNEFFGKMKIITQSARIFTVERFKTIWLMNAGFYDHLLSKR